MTDVEIDRLAVFDTIERRFPCPPGANRIDHQRGITELVDEIIGLVEYSCWDEFE